LSANVQLTTLDLGLLADPKDLSPVALRAALRVQGGFAKRKVAFENSPIALRAVTALRRSRTTHWPFWSL